MKKFDFKKWIIPISLLLFFLFLIFEFDVVENVLVTILKPKNIFVERSSLAEVALWHIILVAISSAVSIFVGISLAIISRLSSIKDLKELFLQLAGIGETIPTVAILALLVPFIGFGIKPVIFALIVYGLLPVLRNTIDGFDTVPTDVKEAAKGLGMSPWQILLKIELPMAFPAILAGVRASIILNISVATIGAVVGANGFGTLIMNGIRSNDTLLLLKGALPVTILALTVDSFFSSVEKKMIWKNQKNGNIAK